MLSKGAFAELDVHLVLQQSLKYNLQMLYVFYKSFTKHKDVIHKHQYKSSHVFAKYCIHQVLKIGRSISEAKRHHYELKMAMVSFECRFGFIFGNHPNLMKTKGQINC
jgi:hypothetical protein